MGQAASAARKSNGIVITLDALGTLYKFRKPVAVQYLEVANRAGVKQEIQVDQLQQAFTKAYKEYALRYPNYGHGTLNDPSEWWRGLVKNTFTQLTHDIPEDLPQKLYDHFSSDKAYELYDDVQPFLQSMHSLRTQFDDPKGPAILTGVVSNSDPRVSNILSALSIRVGDVRVPTRDEVRESAAASVQSGYIQVPWSNAYDITNDFDFLTTSYEAEAEKPSSTIWRYADLQASLVAISKSQKGAELPEGRLKSTFAHFAIAMSNIGKTDSMRWIHIGDEYEKDYVGVKSIGRDALFLDREGNMNVQADKVTSLEDAATVINLMAQEMMRQDGE